MNGPLLKLDQDEHTILDVASEPWVRDTDNEYMSEHEILKACSWVNEHGEGVDVQHDFTPVGGVTVLESYRLPSEMQIGDKRIPKGSWRVKLGITNDEVWASDVSKTKGLTASFARRQSEQQTKDRIHHFVLCRSVC